MTVIALIFRRLMIPNQANFITFIEIGNSCIRISLRLQGFLAAHINEIRGKLGKPRTMLVFRIFTNQGLKTLGGERRKITFIEISHPRHGCGPFLVEGMQRCV